jgi:energy-coupling factor transporter ATP-binding protein EcfA2
MALLHLFKKQEDAMIILDEPETHFNDYWKRQIVDIIDDNLRDVASEVVISTHSSIALTDVFDTEITLLKKSDQDGSIGVVRQLPMQTFGALSSEIMLRIFGASDVVGQRANEFLDMVLKVSSHPKQVEAVWEMMSASNGNQAAKADYERIKGDKDFRRLWA